MADGITIVTGANRGIGLELARLLHTQGVEVVATCRMASDGLIELGCRIEQLDVTDPASVKAFARRITDPVQLLINNAGVLRHDDVESLDFADIELQITTNALGPLRVTTALLDRFAPEARVVFVSSHMGSLQDAVEGGGMYGYRMSKAAANMAARCLSHDLRERQIAVRTIHPGFVRTRMTDNLGRVHPTKAALKLLQQVDTLTLETTGQFVGPDGEALPW
jgi:NAD(P)-dependent dehydrogenase (short-subunit alcohol dehydrogenase family)